MISCGMIILMVIAAPVPHTCTLHKMDEKGCLAMKKRYCLLLVLCLLISVSCASAAESSARSPLQAYLDTLTVISTEPVELHIAIQNAEYCRNYLLDAAFLTRYPNGKIVYHYKTGMTEPPAGIDLIICTPQIIRKCAAAGQLVNLYETPLLSQWPDYWIDIREQAETEGALYGIPHSLVQCYWLWDDAQAQRMGVDRPPMLQTWNDFYRFTQQIKEKAADAGIDNPRIMYGLISSDPNMNGMVDDYLQLYFYQHVLNGGTFHTEEFHDLMELYRVAAQEPFSIVYDGADTKDPLIISFVLTDSFFYDQENAVMMLPPVLDRKAPAYLSRYSAFALPVSNQQPALALDFLAGTLDAQLNRFFTDFNQYFMYSMPEYFVEPVPVELDAYQNNVEEVTLETLALHESACFPPAFGMAEFEMYSFARQHALFDTLEWHSLYPAWQVALNSYINDLDEFSTISDALDDAHTTFKQR